MTSAGWLLMFGGIFATAFGFAVLLCVIVSRARHRVELTREFRSFLTEDLRRREEQVQRALERYGRKDAS